MKRIVLAARKPNNAGATDRNYGPFHTVRFTHQGVMADNDIVLLYDHQKRFWRDPNSESQVYSHIDVVLKDE